jgi:hypothetical protein
VKEGTSGAAERIHLRGWVREAALLGTQRKRVAGGVGAVKAEPGAWWVRPIEPASPAGEVTDPRQEVSEPIGLGRSSRRAQARREVLELRGEKPRILPAPDP